MGSSDTDNEVGIDWRGTSPPGVAKAGKTLEIKIALPAMPNVPGYTKAKDRLSVLPRKSLIILAVATITMTAIGGYYVLNGGNRGVAGVTASTIGPTKGTPTYKTIVPASKSIESLGGWTLISPPDRNPVFAYADKIGNIPINVSQQPLPENFATDTSTQIEELAHGFSADEKITVGSTIVYIGTSAKGPQSVIFNKNDLLVLIKSTNPIANDEWAKYIDSLQ